MCQRVMFEPSLLNFSGFGVMTAIFSRAEILLHLSLTSLLSAIFVLHTSLILRGT